MIRLESVAKSASIPFAARLLYIPMLLATVSFDAARTDSAMVSAALANETIAPEEPSICSTSGLELTNSKSEERNAASNTLNMAERVMYVPSLKRAAN